MLTGAFRLWWAEQLSNLLFCLMCIDSDNAVLGQMFYWRESRSDWLIEQDLVSSLRVRPRVSQLPQYALPQHTPPKILFLTIVFANRKRRCSQPHVLFSLGNSLVKAWVCCIWRCTQIVGGMSLLTYSHLQLKKWELIISLTCKESRESHTIIFDHRQYGADTFQTSFTFRVFPSSVDIVVTS